MAKTEEQLELDALKHAGITGAELPQAKESDDHTLPRQRAMFNVDWLRGPIRLSSISAKPHRDRRSVQRWLKQFAETMEFTIDWLSDEPDLAEVTDSAGKHAGWLVVRRA